MKKIILLAFMSVLYGTTTAQTTVKIQPQAFYSKLSADVNGDGKLESLIREKIDNAYIWYWQDLDGNIALPVITLDMRNEVGRDLFLYGSQGQLIADYNNDGIPDILFDDASYGEINSSCRMFVALSNGEDYTLKELTLNTGYQTGYTQATKVIFQPEKAITLDINRDGRMDFFGMELVGYRKYAPVSYIQTIDGTFQRLSLPVVTDPNEIAKAQYATGATGSYSNNGLNFSGMSSNGRTYTSKEVVSWQAIDINLDGYPDLIDPSGNSFISLPDGRYYSAALSGSVSVADFNSDGVEDLVLYGNDKAVVQMSQPDGSFKEVELMENANITTIYCRDLDGDGLSDVLLCLDSKDGTAYLAFFRNQGNGTFKRTVKSFNNSNLKFKQLYDLNLNGRPTLLAEGGNGYPVIWTRFDWDASFNITESKLLPDDIYVEEDCGEFNIGSYLEFNSYQYPIIRDFFGNGTLGLHCYGYKYRTGEDGRTYNIGTFYFIYQFDGTNTEPQQMAAPLVIPDKQSATVKLEWKAGTDDKTASGDLSYDVEISNDKGKLINTNTPHTYLIAEAGSWPLGQLSARIRAVDANGLAGSWSAPTTWQNTVKNGLITTNENEMTTADTLIVHSLSGTDVTYDIRPDGTIIEQEGATTKIIFSSPGQKTIEAKVSGGIPSSKTVWVDPLGVGSHQIYCSFDRYMFDFNQNGKAEMVTNDKIYTLEDNVWTPYESIDLSDISSYGHLKMITDYNMDGLPDINSYISRNKKAYAWLVNKGDMEFKIVDGFKSTSGDYLLGSSYSTSTSGLVGDFDNDGLTDFCNETSVYRNLGNDTYEKQSLKIFGTSSFKIYAVADFDRDGLLDLLCETTGKAGILHNKGNWQFEDIILPCAVNTSITSVVDINGDGYPDITNRSGVLRYAMLGGKDLNFKEIDYPGLGSRIDWDNDGLVDYEVGENCDKLLISNHGNPIEQDIKDDMSSWNCDMNNDGRPDMYDKLLLSNFSNTAPTAPTTIYATQQGSQVIINWSGATDKETPLTSLRYNISIKEKGATGEGSYIWSPLNMTSDEAVVCPTGTNHYRFATTLPMPLSRFVAGKTYEIRIQAIDNWYAHSPFSTVYEFTPTATTLIDIAAKGGVNKPISFTLTDNSGTTPTIDADGGEVKDGTITWNKAGVKTITVTAGSVVSKTTILIVDRPNLEMSVPTKVLAGQKILVELPESYKSEEAEIDIYSTRNGVGIDYNASENTALLTMPYADGYQKVNFSYTDDIWGNIISTFVIEVSGTNWQPTLSMVGISGNHNLLTWPVDQQQPEASIFNNKVNIYRETSVSDEYELIGEADLSAGQFVDETSTPNVKTYRYYITLQTVYGVESQPSQVHGNIHLMVNRGQGNDINLHWTPYEGAKIAQYRVLAGSSADNLQEIERLSGYAQSYTHKRNSDATTYYAIAYTIKTANQTAASRRSMTEETSKSNIISSDEAHEVTMVKAIAITTKEGSALLSMDNPSLHMKATVTPVVATLGRVEWSILSGDDLAEISSDGTLTILTNLTGGTVTVQARAIDGSDVTATMNITVEKMLPSSIEAITEQNEAGNRKQSVEIYTISGKKVNATSLRALPRGIYIVDGKKVMK